MFEFEIFCEANSEWVFYSSRLSHQNIRENYFINAKGAVLCYSHERCLCVLANKRESASKRETWCAKQKHTTEIFEHAISLMWPLTAFNHLTRHTARLPLRKILFALYIYDAYSQLSILWCENTLRLDFSNSPSVSTRKRQNKLA